MTRYCIGCKKDTLCTDSRQDDRPVSTCNICGRVSTRRARYRAKVYAVKGAAYKKKLEANRLRKMKRRHGEWWYEVWVRDGGACTKCKARRRMVLHHKQYENTVAAQVLLCRVCHGRLHGFDYRRSAERKKMLAHLRSIMKEETDG